MEKIKILEVATALNDGGVERVLLNYISHMDKAKFDFDIAITSSERGILESNFSEAGAAIIRIPKLRKGIFKYCKFVCKLLKNGHYDIVHVHSGYLSFFTLLCARISKVKVRIAHTHYGWKEESIFKKIQRFLLTFLTKRVSNCLFACSDEAGRLTWGKNAKFYTMINGFDLEQFKFSLEKRKEIRAELEFGTSKVIGCVGRLSAQKNHLFLLRVFKEIVKINSDFLLVLVGGGELESKLKEIVKKDDTISDKVRFLGPLRNVFEILNSFDVFLLPSNFEGLGIVFIEAQINGLYCYGSENCPQEANIGGMSFLRLKKTPKEIAREFVDCVKLRGSFRLMDDYKKYDIENCANNLETVYSKLVNGKEGGIHES